MNTQIKGMCLALLVVAAGAGTMAITGCAGDKTDRSTGEYIDDKSLTMRVHSALSDSPEYKFDDVTLNVYRGVVQLNGFVDNLDEKSRAAEIAKGVQGVKDVQNNLSVKGS